MLKVHTNESVREDDVAHCMVTCPLCGQKLTDVTYLKGVLILRIKCRRCKRYIDVDVVGMDD